MASMASMTSSNNGGPAKAEENGRETAKANSDDEEEEGEAEEEEDDGWDDWSVPRGSNEEGEEEDPESMETVQCLFCAETRDSAASIFDHCSGQHSFDFIRLRRDLRLKFYDCLRLINYIRSEVAAKGSESALESLLRHLEASWNAGQNDGQKAGSRPDFGRECGALWSDEKYLAPFMANDALLYTFDYDEDDDEFDDSGNDNNVEAEEVKISSSDTVGGPESVCSFFAEEGPKNAAEKIRTSSSDTARGPGSVSSPFAEEDLNKAASVVPTEIAAAHTSALLAEELSEELSTGGAPDLEDELLSDADSELDMADTLSADNKSEDLEESKISSKSIIHAESKSKKKSKGKVTFAKVADKEKLSINRSYFGSYSGFGIHREMLADRVRTEAYQAALVNNPSLIKDSVVMDVGCGTGILSLFAAKAGARKVIAVDGSEKMTAVATQVAKVNGFLDDCVEKEQRTKNGVMCVVAGMVEELDSTMPVPANSVDVLVSEWMGYCLLFESMLGSVLYARDKWLKPGGAMLPDTATMYVAGFGKGGTSLSFWENVYGFDMQCVGEEVAHDNTEHPVIDVIASKDVITDACQLKEFDLTSMKHEDVDYTADFRVTLLPSALDNETAIASVSADSERQTAASESSSKCIKCYGLVVWFDTGFTSRFCKESPVNLTTSPHTPKTHWSQTLLTFRDPITLCPEGSVVPDTKLDRSKVGSDEFPAVSIGGRISIARSFRFRSIDISLETTASGVDGALKSWPVQMFDI